MQDTYALLLTELKSTILEARYHVARRVNRHLIDLYWEIGRRIVASQEEHGWGKSVVEELSRDLRIAFPESKGFSARNLWDMRLFYLTYKGFSNLQPLVAEIGWAHNLMLLRSSLTTEERVFYLQSAIQGNWSKRRLRDEIRGNAYERSLSSPSQHNFSATLPSDLAEQTEALLKNEYNLDFLLLKEKHREQELEDEIVTHLQAFMLELGFGYTFVGRQYRLSLNKDYYVDLLFFNRKLRALVAVELKTVPFEPSFVGTLNFYLEVMDDTLRMAGENPSIGILLCTEKDDLEVEYALRGATRPMGIVKYRTEGGVPEDLKKYLPSPEQFRRQIDLVRSEFDRRGNN